MIKIPEGYTYNKEMEYWETSCASVYKSQPSAGSYFTKKGWTYGERDGVVWHVNRWYAEADVEHIDVLTCWGTKQYLAGATLLCYIDNDTVRMMRKGAADDILIDGGYFDGQQLKHGLSLMKAGCKVGLWRMANSELMIVAERDRSKDRYAAILISSARATRYSTSEGYDVCILELDLQELCETAAEATKAITVKSKARKTKGANEMIKAYRAYGEWNVTYTQKDGSEHTTRCGDLSEEHLRTWNEGASKIELLIEPLMCDVDDSYVALWELHTEDKDGHSYVARMSDWATLKQAKDELMKYCSRHGDKPVCVMLVAEKKQQASKARKSSKAKPVASKSEQVASVEASKEVQSVANKVVAVKRARKSSNGKASNTHKRARKATGKSSKARKSKKQGIFKVWLGKLQGLLGKVAML